MTYRKRILLASVLVLLPVLVLGAWWRMGRVEVWVDASKLPPVPAKPVPTEFSMVTYNVQARPVFDDSVKKFTLIPPCVNPFDIVVFQECFKDYKRLWAGLTHPVKVYQGDLKAPWKIVGSGLCAAGRFPITGVESMHYSTAGELQNKPASKGALLIHFEVGGSPLDVYTTHKDAGKSLAAMVSKRKQAQELVAFIKAHSSPDVPVVLLGDFNLRFKKPGTPGKGIPDKAPDNWDSLEYYDIIGAICASLGLKDTCTEMTGEPYEHVDHVLFRSGAKATLTPLAWQHDSPEFYDSDAKPLSDHDPVIVRFKITPATP